jgi:hypothetical protein
MRPFCFLAEKPVKASPKQEEQDKEGFTAWGKEVGGLQAGLGFRPGDKRTYSAGETVTLVVRVRNVGTEKVKFHYFSEDSYENPPTVVNGDGKPVPFKGGTTFGLLLPIEESLAPEKEVELCKLILQLRPASEKGKDSPWTLYETGKYQIQYEKIGGNIVSGEIKANPILSKLATGKLELEVKEAEKPPQTGLPKPMVEKKKVYTPDEVMLAEEKARGKANNGKSKIVTVEFKVQAVTKPTEIKLTSFTVRV